MNPIGALMRVLLPAAFVYLAFTFLGHSGGFAALVVLVLALAYMNRALIYQNRASKKYHKGNFEGALKDLKSAVALDPKAAKIRGAYAYLLLKTGHTDEAAVQIDEALNSVKLPADKYSLRVTKSLVLWKQDRIDEAIKELEDLLTAYRHTNVYASLGFLYIEKGDLQKALQFNLESKDYNSSSAIILDNLGTSYYLLGDYENALETFKEAMKQKPYFPEAYYNYARVLDATGDWEKALYMVRHALTLRFWNTSTIKKSDVESLLAYLEAKEKEALEKERLERAKKAEVEGSWKESEAQAANASSENP